MPQGKTALVLSAGGMFGAYQAGAYKAITQLEPLDIIVGSSVGALNGWVIASGCTPEHLIHRWMEPSAGDTLTPHPRAGWRNGWFDPAPLRAQAEDLFLRYKPRMPFGVVVNELPWVRPRLVCHPGILPEHLRATCSVPVFLPPVRIAERRYVDGGLLNKLPIWAAAETGATRVIAVDSLPDFAGRWIRLALTSVHMIRGTRRYPKTLEVTLISPSEPLGSPRDAVCWKRENIERWINLGERDAARTLSLQPAASIREDCEA